jgi:sec-independent protein translocase protein TatA
MFGIGTTELLVVGVVVLLLFGNRLPSVMRGLGGGLREFRDGVNGVERDVEEAAK